MCEFRILLAPKQEAKDGSSESCQTQQHSSIMSYFSKLSNCEFKNISSYKLFWKNRYHKCFNEMHQRVN